jgi:hypothetical protein
MQHHVIVSFGKDRQFDYKFSAADLSGSAADEARQWFDREFLALACEVATPTGKILAVDRILSVAKYAGAQRFVDQPDWASQFSRFTAAILGRELIRIDVEHYSIGY